MGVMTTAAPHLFSPLALGHLTLPHRVVVSPMCMYSANEQGQANDFHLVHYGQFALGQAGLILAEATAVSPEGRISPQDLGLWQDDQIAPLRRVTDFVHAQGGLIGVQLAHAGRKASTFAPGRGAGYLAPEAGGWQVVGPDAQAYRDSYGQPRALGRAEIGRVVEDFAAAAARARTAGFDALELHAAHGYLLHQFLSPLSNSRTDEYGGSFENRIRLLLEVVRAVRRNWPQPLPLLVRVSATDWAEHLEAESWTLEQTTELAKLLLAEGVDLLDVSTGGLSPLQKISVAPAYQVPFGAHIRAQVPGLKVMTVGLIDTPQQAQHIVEAGQADVVALGRPFLRDPHWVQRAAHELGAELPLPLPYMRAGWGR